MCFHFYHTNRILKARSMEHPREKKIVIRLTLILFPTFCVARIHSWENKINVRILQFILVLVSFLVNYGNVTATLRSLKNNLGIESHSSVGCLGSEGQFFPLVSLGTSYIDIVNWRLDWDPGRTGLSLPHVVSGHLLQHGSQVLHRATLEGFSGPLTWHLCHVPKSTKAQRWKPLGHLKD